MTACPPRRFGQSLAARRRYGDEVGQTNLDDTLIKGHHQIDAELKLHHKLFFRTSGALTKINCITIDHTAHKITLAVDGFSRA
jgi:hypothetical protein